MGQIIQVENLSLSFPGKEALRGVSFALHPGELLVLAGESGSGKSLLCRTLLGLPPNGAKVAFDRFQRPAPAEMSLVMQNAMTALDPAMPVGKQIMEANRACPPDPAELLHRVGIDHSELRARQYPGEFSGGMRQRAAVAVALAMRPKVIFADEPTTALDPEMQGKIMRLLDEIRRCHTAILFVTHDLNLARDYADRVLIMKEGRIIEQGTATEIFEHPQEAYTKELIRYSAGYDPAGHTHGNVHYHDLMMHSHGYRGAHTHVGDEGDLASNAYMAFAEYIASVGHTASAGYTASVGHTVSTMYTASPLHPPSEDNPAHLPSPLVEAKMLSKSYPLGSGQTNRVLEHVNLAIYPGEITGLCGSSGIGKSTLARCLAGLEKPSSGKRLALRGLNIQMIFQDSASALNPRMTVERLIGEPLYLRDRKHPSRATILALMGETELEAELITRYPSELSGGQRQRVAIARAIATLPDLIIADEPVSSLDAATCSKIIHLLKKLKDQHKLTMLLISHDLRLLAHVSDRIVSL